MLRKKNQHIINCIPAKTKRCFACRNSTAKQREDFDVVHQPWFSCKFLVKDLRFFRFPVSLLKNTNNNNKMYAFLKRIAKKIFKEAKNIIRPLYNLYYNIRKSKCIIDVLANEFELCVPPEVLLSKEFVDGRFNRYDIVVRLITIENDINKKENAFELYNKMQANRGAPKGSKDKFKKLYNSFLENGYDWKSVIQISKEGYLWDGSHRLSLALFFQIPLISAQILQSRNEKVHYGLNWFSNHGFSIDECALLKRKRDLLFVEKGLFFPFILWPTVTQYFNQIETEIKNKFRIVNSEEYNFNNSDFEKIVRSLYEIDDIATWKVNKKLLGMKDCEKKIKVIWLEFPNPKYRKKQINNAHISTAGERLKSEIRNKYKNKIDNYFYDIICHTGDNYEHNKKIMLILQEYFKTI